MSATESDAGEPHGGPGAEVPMSEAGRVHEPWRAVVALCEVVVAVALVVAAVWSWDSAVVAIELPGLPQSDHAVTRTLGNWVALAVLAVTVAGLLTLDALRQGVLAWRVRPRREEAKPTSTSPGEA